MNLPDSIQKIRKHRLFNKYVITVVLFFVFLIFFDSNNLLNRYKAKKEIRKVQTEIDIYNKKTDEDQKKLDALKDNVDSLETFAREQYYMKKNNEDIYIIKEK